MRSLNVYSYAPLVKMVNHSLIDRCGRECSL